MLVVKEPAVWVNSAQEGKTDKRRPWQRGPSHVWDIRASLWVRLSTQLIIICGKLTLKSTIIEKKTLLTCQTLPTLGFYVSCLSKSSLSVHYLVSAFHRHSCGRLSPPYSCCSSWALPHTLLQCLNFGNLFLLSVQAVGLCKGHTYFSVSAGRGRFYTAAVCHSWKLSNLKCQCSKAVKPANLHDHLGFSPSQHHSNSTELVNKMAAHL